MGLCVTRRIGERVLIRLEDGRTVVVEVREARFGKARISIDAPISIEIHREEIAPPLPERKVE